AQDGRWLGASNPVLLEDFARQVEPPSRGVLGEVAQDIGQLQRPSKRIRNPMGGVAGIAEYVNREMADCACDPCTIEIQACEIGSPNVFPSIHFHAGEDRKEIFFAKLKASCRFQQCTRHEVASLSVEEVVDFSAPCGQSRELLFD